MASTHRIRVDISKLFSTFILVIGILFLMLLSISSVILTVYSYYPPASGPVFSTAPMVPVVIGVMIWIATSLFLARTKRLPRHTHCAVVASLMIGVLCALWVFVSDSGPTYDSLDISCGAFALNPSLIPSSFSDEWLSAGKYAWGMGWEKGTTHLSYLGRFPHQIPYLLVVYVCQQIAGEHFVLLSQLLNAFSNGVSTWLICMIVWELSNSRCAVFLASGLLLLFCPFILFSTFIYGNLVCLPWALGAWLCCIKALGDGSKSENNKVPCKPLVFLLLAGILLSFAILMKSTMNIASIAFLIVVIVVSLNRRKWALLPLAIVPILLTPLLTGVLDSYVESKTGTDLHNSVPMTSFIVMGIGAGNEYRTNKDNQAMSESDLLWPGYFDAFVWSIPEEEGFDSWSELNRYAISLRLSRFAKNPGYMVQFFARKVAIEWLEPTLEGLMVSNYSGRKTGAFNVRFADDHREYTRFARSIYYGKLKDIVFYVGDLAQSLISIGALCWCVRSYKNRRQISVVHLFSLVFVLGAAFLYLFWENKSQYMLPYWLFLVPYAACGWASVTEMIDKRVRMLRGCDVADGRTV